MSDAVNDILQKRGRFLAFLKARLKNEELAEEILQAAYVKSFVKASALKKGENVVAWFYRVLRNAIIDHHRHAQVERKALSRPTPAEDPKLEQTVCQCVSALVPGLKPEYAELIRKVDLEGAPVRDVAADVGTTPNNASVRLLRARKALRDQVIQVCGACAEHGCLDCSCGRK